MSTLLKNQIKQAKQSNNLVWLWFLHIILGINHVFALLFLPASSSFQTVNDLSENGYTASYLGHQRMQHNVRFGTLAYSLVLASSLIFITSTIEIIYPNQFGQAALASSIVVNTNSFDNDGSCDVGPGDCSILEALAAAGVNDTITFSSDMIITVTDRIDVQVQGLTIDGTGHTVRFDGGNANQQIFFSAQNDITYRNFTIQNTTGTGIRVETGGLVDHVTFSNMSGFATSFYVDGNATFTNNTFNTVGTAIFNQDAPGITVTNNQFTNVETGIRSFGTGSSTTINGNTFDGCSDVCIAQYSGGTTVIGYSSANTLNLSGSGSGIYVGASDSVVLNNVINDAGGYGLNLDAVNNVSVSGNTIDGAGDSGVRIVSSSNVDFNTNTIANADPYGIVIDSSTYVTANANAISGSNSYGIYVFNGEHNTVYSNSVTNSGQDAVVNYGSNFNTYYGNTITTASGAGFRVDSSNEVVFGSTRLATNAANVISGTINGIAVLNNVTDFEARKNRIKLPSDTTGSSVYIFSGATPPNGELTINTHKREAITGTVVGYEVYDVYQKDVDGWIEYVGSATVNGGTWTYDATSLYGTVYVQGVAEPGSTSYVGLQQPTTNMEVSNVDATNITSSAATITWDSTIGGSSVVTYTSDPLFQQVNLAQATGSTDVTSHSVALNGLSANTTYYFMIESSSTNNQYNKASSALGSFVTAPDSSNGGGDGNNGGGDGGDGGDDSIEYLLNILSQITVKHKYGTEEVNGDGTTDTEFPLGNLTFTFTDTDALAPEGSRIHFVLRDLENLSAAVVNQKKAFNAKHQANFQVKQKLLSVEKTYAVESGAMYHGEYINGAELARRFTFSLLDAPQLLEPTGGVSYRTPSRFVVASKAPSVTVFLDDLDGNNVEHCVATMDDGIGECSFDSSVAIGQYRYRVIDARGGQVQGSLLISDFAPNNILTTDRRSENYYKRFVYTGQPTFVGIAPAGSSVELSIPQIDGVMEADVAPAKKGITTWQFTLRLTDLPLGTTNVSVTTKNKSGKVTSSITYPVVRVPRAVAPAILAPTSGESFTEAPTLYLLGAANHVAELYNSSGVQLDAKDYVDTTVAFDLAEWYTTPGTYTITARNRNSMNVPSTDTEFTFTILAPAVIVPGPVRDEDNGANTNTNSNSNENTNSNSNTNTDTGSNDNGNSNTNTDNTNTGNINASNVNSDVTNTNTGTINGNTNTSVLGDADNDGLGDNEESEYGTDKNNPDTDGDEMSDGDEVAFGSDPLTADADEDGLTDPQEYTFSTNPNLADSDADGVLDGVEVVSETNPLDPDTDADGLNDDEFTAHGTKALDPDSDDDGLLDGEELARACDPKKSDSDDDGVDDLTEAMAGTSCVSEDNLWANLTGIQGVLQSFANNTFVSTTGEQIGKYPAITRQLVQYDGNELSGNVFGQVKQATVLNLVPGSNTTVTDGNVKVMTKKSEINIQDWFTGNNTAKEDDSYVMVYGKIDLPKEVKEQPAYVVLTFFSTPVVKIAQVDVSGQWTMTVPAELLTAGEHVAYASVDVNGTQTEQVEVAKFVIKQERRLSNTSWLILINVGVAFLAVLVAFYVHIRRRRAEANLTSTTL